MNPPSPRPRDRLADVRPLLHWRVLAPVLGGAIAPKCLLCAAAYIASGAALFGSRAELCGDAEDRGAAMLFVPLAGAALGAGFAAWRHVRRSRASLHRIESGRRALD
jgi:hypothetical protein